MEKTVKHNLTLPGYKLSTNYELLWDLIQKGHRIAAWLVYTDEYKDPIWDIVEVKLAYQSTRYDIGIRGHSYCGFDNTLKDFERVCEKYSLHFLEPTK